MKSKNELIAAIEVWANSMEPLVIRALVEYTPIVNEIIALNITDGRKIESILTGILDFCFDENMLLLYKKLCRHYYFINPEAATDYVYYYFERFEMETGIE